MLYRRFLLYLQDYREELRELGRRSVLSEFDLEAEASEKNDYKIFVDFLNRFEIEKRCLRLDVRRNSSL